MSIGLGDINKQALIDTVNQGGDRLDQLEALIQASIEQLEGKAETDEMAVIDHAALQLRVVLDPVLTEIRAMNGMLGQLLQRGLNVGGMIVTLGPVPTPPPTPVSKA